MRKAARQSNSRRWPEPIFCVVCHAGQQGLAFYSSAVQLATYFCIEIYGIEDDEML